MWKGKPAPKTSFRSDVRDAELEALRQRGLAKLSDTNAKLMVERTAADAALRDLEARKAATSQFEASGDGELSQYDSLYLSVHQWRKDCSRKEREARLRCEQYVHKFGSQEKIKLPSPASSGSVSPPPWKDCENDSHAMSPALSVRLSAPPPSQTTPSLQVPATSQQQEQPGEPIKADNHTFIRTIAKETRKEPVEMMKKADDDNDGSVLQWQEMDDDDDDTDTIISGVTSFSTYPSEVGSASLQASNPDEQYDKQMESILVEYKTRTKQPTASPVCDDTYQREYYHELKTDRTQGQSPAKKIATSPQNTMLSQEQVKPEYTITEGRRSSGISQYRRRRNRMFVLAVFTVTFLAGITRLYLHSNPQAAEMVSNWVKRPAEHKIASEADARLQAELQMANEAKARAVAEIQTRKAVEVKLKAEVEEHNVRRNSLEEAERREEGERRVAEEKDYRPIGCSLPFAYVVRGKCDRPASKSPIFDLQELANSMMQ